MPQAKLKTHKKNGIEIFVSKTNYSVIQSQQFN